MLSKENKSMHAEYLMLKHVGVLVEEIAEGGATSWEEAAHTCPLLTNL